MTYMLSKKVDTFINILFYFDNLYKQIISFTQLCKILLYISKIGLYEIMQFSSNLNFESIGVN